MSFLIVDGDSRRIPLPDKSVHLAVGSPPYYRLRAYLGDGDGRKSLEVGSERREEDFIRNLVVAYREVRRVLRDDGTCWVNIGDGYDHRKRLRLMPHRVALALQADGWFVRQDVVWDKPNTMPGSASDRTDRSHEYVFLLSKSGRYFYDKYGDPVAQKTLGARHEGKSDYQEGHPSKGGISRRVLNPLGGNQRSVWRISVRRFSGAHFACYPPDLAARCIRLGTSEKGVCPECGAQWRRLIDRERVPTRPGVNTKLYAKSDGDGATAAAMGWNRPLVIGNRDPRRHVTVAAFRGWVPGCRCGHEETVPALVLDNWCGAASTAVACKLLGRRFIGVELGHDYSVMGRERVEAYVPPRPRIPRGERRRAPLPNQMSFAWS